MSKTAIADRDGMKVDTDMVAFDDELYADVPGGGFENVTSRDVAIPYIRILQATSGEIKKGPSKIPGAEEGDIFNSGTGEIVKGSEGITVVPCAFQKKWIRTGPRIPDGKGGTKAGPYVATLDAEPKGDMVGRSIFLDNGDEVSDRSDHYVIVVSGASLWQKALIRMAGSQLKHSRFWNGLMQNNIRMLNGERTIWPMFSHTYHLTTGVETKGTNSWAGWVIGKPERITNVQLARFAKEFYLAVRGGTVKAADPVDEDITPDIKADDVPF